MKGRKYKPLARAPGLINRNLVQNSLNFIYLGSIFFINVTNESSVPQNPLSFDNFLIIQLKTTLSNDVIV